MATHTEPTIPGLSSERIKAVATLAVTLVTLANAALTLSGHNPLPFSESDAYSAVSGGVAFAATIYAWWKNQNLTAAAVEGAQLTRAIKATPATGTVVSGNIDEGDEAAPEGSEDVGDGHIDIDPATDLAAEDA